MCDNMTVISNINNIDGTKSVSCNKVASNILDFSITEKLWISAAYVPNASDKEADQ